ncbi:MAG: SusD/RagB family nutrient-binding outer membrane lipoprotein [Tannerellaceae bacterium]
MMKNNIVKQFKNTFLLYAMAALAGMTACTGNFEGINTNPNGMEPSQVKITSRFNQPIIGVYNNYQNINDEFMLQQNLNADMYSGYITTNSAFNGNSNNSHYAMVDRWNNEAFRDGMLYVMTPISQILKLTEDKDYTAIAKIIRVMGIHRVTDIYGPIPYSKAMQGGASVPYDSQESIYMAFLAELDQAIKELTDFVDSGQALPSRISEFDIVCRADHKQWIRFANTLRLRLAMRLAVVKPDVAKTNAEAAVSHKYGVLAAGNPNVEVIDATVMNPLNECTMGYNDMRAGASIVCMLKGYNDPRLSVYITPIGWFKIGGHEQDIIDKNGKETGNKGKYIGIRQGAVVDKGIYQVYSTANLSLSTKMADYTGNKTQLSNHLPWMKVAEAYFLRAEGALRGWNMGGSAKELYEQGIQVSFDEYAIPASEYAKYIENSTDICADYEDPHEPSYNMKGIDKCTVKWDEAASREEKLHRIINQKWIAMYPEGEEAWSEFRRTGFPKLFPVAVNKSAGEWKIPDGEFIKRLPFPKNEKDANAEEVAKAVSLLNGTDSPATRLWWDTGKNF